MSQPERWNRGDRRGERRGGGEFSRDRVGVLREPGVFDRFRFAPADDRSREDNGGDGARGDCGLGTAATKAASFDGDFC